MIFAFSAFLVFLAIGTPIVFVLGIAATLTLMLTQPDIPITIVTQRIYDGLNSFTIMAIPFFIVAGHSGQQKWLGAPRQFNGTWLGHRRNSKSGSGQHGNIKALGWDTAEIAAKVARDTMAI